MTDLAAQIPGYISIAIALGGLWLSRASNARAIEAANSSAADERARLRGEIDTLKEWQRSKSIDRAEHDSVEKRVSVLENEMREVCSQVTEIAKQSAVLNVKIDGLTDLLKAQDVSTKHQFRNISMAIDALAPRRRRPAADEAA